MSISYLLNLRFVHKLLEHIPPDDFLSFFLGVLRNEILDAHEATAHSDQDFVTFFDFDVDSFLAELVNTF